jgi:hypothetical protein
MIQSFGQIDVAAGGTPARATANLAVPANPCPLQSLMVQAAPANTGLIYVIFSPEGSPGDNRTTRTKVIGIIGAPSAATAHPPSASFTMPNAQNALDLRDIWIDASVNGDDAIIVGAHSDMMRRT